MDYEKERGIMMANRKAVHARCQGDDFTPADKKLFRHEQCSHIEPFIPAVGQPTVFHTECKCEIYMHPAYWWENGRHCPMADHYRPDLTKEKIVGRVGQQKSKKKSRR